MSEAMTELTHLFVFCSSHEDMPTENGLIAVCGTPYHGIEGWEGKIMICTVCADLEHSPKLTCTVCGDPC